MASFEYDNGASAHFKKKRRKKNAEHKQCVRCHFQSDVHGSQIDERKDRICSYICLDVVVQATEQTFIFPDIFHFVHGFLRRHLYPRWRGYKNEPCLLCVHCILYTVQYSDPSASQRTHTHTRAHDHSFDQILLLLLNLLVRKHAAHSMLFTMYFR